MPHRPQEIAGINDGLGKHHDFLIRPAMTNCVALEGYPAYTLFSINVNHHFGEEYMLCLGVLLWIDLWMVC